MALGCTGNGRRVVLVDGSASEAVVWEWPVGAGALRLVSGYTIPYRWVGGARRWAGGHGIDSWGGM
jgi:hypothetical protein